jgi:hypothetical protein
MSRMTAPAMPSNLPAIRNAQLPSAYVAAKTALTECARIDECKDWADKAAALASYAKQADDRALQEMAVKIRARAIDRVGALMREIESDEQAEQRKRENLRHGPRSIGGGASRKQAALDAGLSRRQAETALQVNAVPRDEFEQLVEGGATVGELANRGKKAPPPKPPDLDGRDPEHP